jgi:hypothetical protein
MAKKDARNRTPSKSTQFEMLIREERDLNPTFRLLWLMTALSANKQHRFFMSEAKMALQLKTTEWQIGNSLKLILALEPRLFRPAQPAEPGTTA